MSDLAICTIISKNYLPFARTLAQSFLRHNRGRVFVLLVDKIDGYFKPEDEPFELIEIETLRDVIPNFDRFCFQYTILELNTGVKPFLLEYLFNKYGLRKLIYFDPDILITNSLDELSKLLDQYSFILIPHLTSPIDDHYKPGEIEILQSGTYNLGFIALSKTPSVMDMLTWWQERLYNQCIVAIEKGLFVDQKWIDLLPGFFQDVFILRHPGYNVAYWNYHCRKVHMKNDQIYVNDEPSYFLHFSGFNPEDLRLVSKHQNRFTLDRLKDMKPVFELYRDHLMLNGWKECKHWPYVFSCFDNGVRIPDFVRRLYLEIGNETNKFSSPFSTESNDHSYFEWLQEKIDGRTPVISRLMYEIYKSRIDIQLAFPSLWGRDRERFWTWMITVGKMDYQLDDRFFENSMTSIKGSTGRRPIKFYLFKLINKIKSSLWRIVTRLFGKRHPLIQILRNLNAYLNRIFMWGTDSLAIRKSINGIKTGREIGVNIAGYINSEHGVGEAVRANIRAFEAAEIPHALNNVASSSRQEDNTYTAFCLGNPYDINFIHVNADQVPAFYQQNGEQYFRGKYNIGYWVWELSDFPEDWTDRFQYFDEIWTASHFCADSISKASPLPVIRIPHSITMSGMESRKRSDFGMEESSYTFLFIFDLLSYFERKNPLALIKAFKMAFQPHENVQLVLKCSSSEWNPPALEKIHESLQGCRAILIDNVLPKAELNSLIDLSDCYVSLHRSEGFGLPLAEAMYLGKPVIATAYSGNMDFMNVNNSFLVKYKFAEIEKDVGPYKAGSMWAEPDVNHAAELMRYVYEHQEASAEIGKIAAEDIKNKFNPHEIGKLIRNRMKIITEYQSKQHKSLGY